MLLFVYLFLHHLLEVFRDYFCFQTQGSILGVLWGICGYWELNPDDSSNHKSHKIASKLYARQAYNLLFYHSGFIVLHYSDKETKIIQLVKWPNWALSKPTLPLMLLASYSPSLCFSNCSRNVYSGKYRINVCSITQSWKNRKKLHKKYPDSDLEFFFHACMIQKRTL